MQHPLAPRFFRSQSTLHTLMSCLAVMACLAGGPVVADDPPQASPATPPAASPPAPPAKPAPQPQTVADRIVARTNATRQAHRLPALQTEPRLTAAAQSLANYMAQTGRFSHQADGRTPSQRVDAQQYRWRFVAENIAFRSHSGANTDESARLTMDQWINSPGHRQNLLSPRATQIGVATAQAPNGALYSVQVFGAPQ